MVLATLGGTVAGAVGVAGAMSAFGPEARKVTPAASTSNHVMFNGPAGQNARSAPAAPAPQPRVDCHKLKCVALTFDDGPVMDTSKVLDMLKAKKARATFFLLGMQAVQFPDIVKRQAAEGHEIGNHTFTHAKLQGAPAGTVLSEINRTQNAIKGVTGKWPTVLRPTYGSTDKQLDGICQQHKLSEILWSVDPVDWKDRDSKKIADRVVTQAQPGGIVILHDVKPTTVAAVPEILNKLSQKGFTFVTVSEIYGNQLKPGQKYPAFLGSPQAGLAPYGT
ncbi:MAG: Bifunctional xylanase/deacetylase precursor [Streptosporangiaceae bacterium]|nr:Bifunctional xylanase/deacetylase precursor [Streptosporangiaceae bacterium]